MPYLVGPEAGTCGTTTSLAIPWGLVGDQRPRPRSHPLVYRLTAKPVKANLVATLDDKLIGFVET